MGKLLTTHIYLGSVYSDKVSLDNRGIETVDLFDFSPSAAHIIRWDIVEGLGTILEEMYIPFLTYARHCLVSTIYKQP